MQENKHQPKKSLKSIFLKPPLWGGLVGLLIFFSCQKDQPEDYYYPKISNITVTPQAVVEFEDTVIISFEYEDRDGDLGFSDPNRASLSVKDSRLQNADWYHVQPLAPMGSEVHITGTLDVKLNNLFLIGNAQSETLTLTVQIEDRAGNLSNELVSNTVTVTQAP